MTQKRREIEQTKYKCTGRLMLYMYLIYICVTNTLYTSEGVRTMIYQKIDLCLNKRLYQYILKIPNKLVAQSIQITVDKSKLYNVFVSLQATIITNRLQKIHKNGSTDLLPHRTKGKQSN